MRLEGTHLFAAPRTAVWEALMDPGVLARALPGGEQLDQVGDNQYRAVMNVKVGPVQGRFEGRIELADIAVLDRYVMRVDGQGAPGFVSGEGLLQLADQAGGGTLLTYAGDVNVGGSIARVSQRLIESTAKSLTRQGLEVLDQMLQARLQPVAVLLEEPLLEEGGEELPAHEVPPGEPPGEPLGAQATRRQPTGAQPFPSAPSAQGPSAASIGVQVAKDVVKDLTKDYIPEDKQEQVVWFSLGALAMLLFVVLVRLVQKD